MIFLTVNMEKFGSRCAGGPHVVADAVRKFLWKLDQGSGWEAGERAPRVTPAPHQAETVTPDIKYRFVLPGAPWRLSKWRANLKSGSVWGS